MRFGSREIERLLAARYGILDDMTLAFRGRLDRFRKLGCPHGVKMGKGKAASYDWAQVIELSLALDLVDLGLSPEHASTIVGTMRSEILLSAAQLTTTEGGAASDVIDSAVAAGKWPVDSTIFICTSAQALGRLKPDRAIEPIMWFLSVRQLREHLAEATDTFSKLILIDLGSTVASAIRFAFVATGQTIDHLIADFRAWSSRTVDQSTQEVLDALDS